MLLLLLYRQRWVVRAASLVSSRFLPRWRADLIAGGRSGLTSLQVLQQPRALLHIVGWSSISWGSAILTNYLLFRALNLAIPTIAALLILVVLHVGISLPSLPASVGIFEYLCMLSLGLFGIDKSVALSFGILLHALILLPTVAGLLLFWFSGLSLKQIQQPDMDIEECR